MTDSPEKAAFHRTLPTKRMAAGWVIQNAEQQFLVVKPTYKDQWELPGGVVEDDESPWHACRREVLEELGIDVDPGSLLCVDYCSNQPGYSESLQFLFYGGTLRTDLIAQITLDEDELSDMEWVDLSSAVQLLGRRVSRRLATAAPHLGPRGLFLVDQALPIAPGYGVQPQF